MILEDDVIWSKSIDKRSIRDLGKVKEKADIIYIGSLYWAYRQVIGIKKYLKENSVI